MKVYYSNSLWCKGRGLWGWPQRVNWQFEYAGAKRYIPRYTAFQGALSLMLLAFWMKQSSMSLWKNMKWLRSKTLTHCKVTF